MTGGSSNDLFDFDSIADSKKGLLRDVITDISGLGGGDLDKIDFSDIDAKKGGADNAFKFITSHFHNKAGELLVKFNAAVDIAIVSGDVNGDGKADFQIEVHTTELLQNLDFVLLSIRLCRARSLEAAGHQGREVPVLASPLLSGSD